MKTDKPLTITRLTSENVKRLNCVTITPDGSMVVIGGNNGQGKSSVLDSIAYAMGGTKLIPSKPIRAGQKAAKITLDLGEFVVERKFTEAGSTLTVRSPEGASYPSPQAMLDKLCSKLAFDPLEFSRQKPVEQLAALKGLVNLDFSEQDKSRKALYDERTLVNRDADALKSRLAALSVDESAPDAEVKLADLLAELKRRQEANEANDKLRRQAEDSADQCETLSDRIEDIDRQIRELYEAKEKLGKTLAAKKSAADEQWEKCKGLNDLDVAEVESQIETAEATNALVRTKQQARKLQDERKAKLSRSEDLSAQIKGIDQEKADAMAAAQFPVDGLGFDDSGVTMNGLPFEQASSAERLRVSVAMGLALNPRLKVLLIRDGSLLDESSLSMIAQMADAAGAQVWCERVGEGKECSVILEDGRVRDDAIESSETDEHVAVTA